MAEKSQSPLPPSSSTTSELKFLKNVREANTIRQKLERAIRDFATDENIANLKISKDEGIKFIKNGNLNIPRYENNLIYVDPENPHIFCTNRRNKKKVEFSLNEKENLPVILTHSEEEKNVTIYACLSALYVVTEEKSGYQKPYFRNYTYGCLIKLSYMNEDGNVDKETFRLYDLLCGKYYAFKHNEETTTTTTTTTLLEEIENKNLRLKEIARDLLKQKHDDETLKPENSSLKLHFNEINFSTHQVKTTTTTTTEMRGDDGDDNNNDDDDDDDNGDKVLITPFEISDYKIGATKLRIDEKFIGTSISLTIVREFETREKHNNTNTTNIKGLYSDSFFKDEGNLGLPSIFTKGSCLSIYEDIRKLEKKHKNLNTGGNLEKLIENFLILNKSELKDEKKKQSVSDGVGGGGGGSGCRMTKTKRIVCGHLLLTFSIEDLKTPSEEEPECLFVDPENIQKRLLRNEVIPKLLDDFKIILDSPLNHTCLSYALNHIKNFSVSKETEEHVRENLENEENTDNRKNKYTKSGKVYEYLETFRLKYSFFDISPIHSPDMENKYFFLTNSSPRAYLNSAYIIGMNSLYLNTSIIIHDPRRNNRAYKVIPKREHRPPGKNDAAATAAAAAAADSDSDDDGDDEDNGNKSSNNLNNDNRGIGRNDDEEDHKKSVFLMKIKNSKVDNYMAMMIRYLISFVKTINFESINDEVKIKIPLEKENNEEGLEVLLQFSRKPISILDSRNIDRTVLAAAEKALNECFIPYVYEFSNNGFPKTSMFEFIKDKIEKIKEDMKSICKSRNKIEEIVRNHNKNGYDVNKMKKCAPSAQNTSKEELIKTKTTTTGKKRKRFESNDDRITVNGSSGSGNDDKGKKRFRPSPENADISGVVAHAESHHHQHPHSNTNYKKSENNKSASSPNRSKTAMKKNNHNNNNKTGQPFENKKNESTTSPLLSNFNSIKKGSQEVNSKLLNKNDARVVIMKDGDGDFPAAATAAAAEKETTREKQKYKKQQQQQHQHQPHLPKLSNEFERRKVNNNNNIPQQKDDGILTDSLEINGGSAHCQSSLITSTISITNNYSNANNIRACAGKGLRGKEKSGLDGYVDSYPHNVFEENIKTPISPLSSEPEETNNKSIGSKDIYSFDNDVYCGELNDIVVAQLQKKSN